MHCVPFLVIPLHAVTVFVTWVLGVGVAMRALFALCVCACAGWQLAIVHMSARNSNLNDKGDFIYADLIMA